MKTLQPLLICLTALGLSPWKARAPPARTLHCPMVMEAISLFCLCAQFNPAPACGRGLWCEAAAILSSILPLDETRGFRRAATLDTLDTMPVIVRYHDSESVVSLLEQELVGQQSNTASYTYVAVGDEIEVEDQVGLPGNLPHMAVFDAPCVHGCMQDGFLRGHGTYMMEGRLIATLCGVVERVNKLVYVRPLKSRLVPGSSHADVMPV